MAGRLSECDYASLKEAKTSDQSSLSDFNNESETYIAVVSLPRRNIERYADEVWPEVGMPEWALKTFLERRSGYRSNSAIEDAHNEAYEDINLDAIYKKHIRASDEATNRINEAAERLLSGENITLVCYESDGDSCHRHHLKQLIERRVEQRDSGQFRLRV